MAVFVSAGYASGMADFPDVLDAMGKTPREFGGVHLHFEGFHVVDGRRAVALVLAQAAFLPCAGATVHVVDGDAVLASAALPALADGRVVRLRLPIVRTGDGDTLTLRIDAPEPAPKAERVRPAWKLLDTFEIPRLSEMDPVSTDGGINVMGSIALTAIAGPLAGAVVVQLAGGSATLDANTTTRVHRAMELPPLSAGRLDGVAKPLARTEEEIVWRPGDPLPEAPPPVPLVKPQVAAATRWCRTCGFEGPAAEYERARNCPRCDEPWF